MARYIFRRLLAIPLVLFLAHFAGYAYTSLARYMQAAQNPFGTRDIGPPPVFTDYLEYLKQLTRFDLGPYPVGVSETIAGVLSRSFLASISLITTAILLSILLGMLLGMSAVKTETHSVSRWLTSLSAAGLAIPGFYLGAVLIFWMISITLKGGPGTSPPLPVSGGGLDAHLILPTLALMVRPSAQIARVTAEVLAGEFSQQYIVAARAFGVRWNTIRWKHALRNVLVPVILTIASSFRLLLGELILVEWLFSYPGLGSLLAQTLVPPNVASFGGLIGEGQLFLYPPLLTPLVTLFAFFFVFIDSLVSIAARAIDPRLRLAEDRTHAAAEL